MRNWAVSNRQTGDSGWREEEGGGAVVAYGVHSDRLGTCTTTAWMSACSVTGEQHHGVPENRGTPDEYMHGRL